MSVANKFSALVAGVVFGLGLVISGMTDPLKVIAFLKLAPGWNPALIFVMGSALLVSVVGFTLAKGRAAPFFAELFMAPTKSSVDARLLVGAAIFGVGWGVYGYCPGPAISALAYLHTETALFLAAMLGGMAIANKIP